MAQTLSETISGRAISGWCGFCTVLTTRGERYVSTRVMGYRYGEDLLKASVRHTDR
jgi:hypothetical protein